MTTRINFEVDNIFDDDDVEQSEDVEALFLEARPMNPNKPTPVSTRKYIKKFVKLCCSASFLILGLFALFSFSSVLRRRAVVEGALDSLRSSSKAELEQLFAFSTSQGRRLLLCGLASLGCFATVGWSTLRPIYKKTERCSLTLCVASFLLFGVVLVVQEHPNDQWLEEKTVRDVNVLIKSVKDDALLEKAFAPLDCPKIPPCTSDCAPTEKGEVPKNSVPCGETISGLLNIGASFAFLSEITLCLLSLFVLVFHSEYVLARC
ncbi:hypothetical protein AGDE_15654 [Angomonas deanei]|uniref:Uncharacterized protein n=1 Tax=Angomonas deanei TaxID=59799 RepID=A0A7G2CG61_9TRYP|nr:hypothetical protein AGDE_15654 [Angomonas deanei]CAD2217854.1 hypothetical protein, conserved [Angomonas deanei]|eukprot:EPY18707.1 hypothetical protein AGDE_15654 [Angomonas deanei]